MRGPRRRRSASEGRRGTGGATIRPYNEYTLRRLTGSEREGGGTVMALAKLGLAAVVLAMLLAGDVPRQPAGRWRRHKLDSSSTLSAPVAAASLWVGNREGRHPEPARCGLLPTLHADGWREPVTRPGTRGLRHAHRWTAQRHLRDRQNGCRPLSTSRTPKREQNPTPTGLGRATASRYAANGDIWSAWPDGSAQRNLTNTPDLVEADPSWSPDGSQNRLYVEPDLQPEIETIDLDTATRTPGRRRQGPG